MKSAKETQIKHIRDSEPDRLVMCLDHLQDGDMLVISGSVPASLSADLHERIMKRVQGKAIRIVVNAAGELLNRGLKHRPFLIKPNHHELGDLFGVRIDALQDAFPYARQLQAMDAQNVLVSMGASGALLIGEDGREYVCALRRANRSIRSGQAISGRSAVPARFQKRWQKLPECLPCSLN